MCCFIKSFRRKKIDGHIYLCFILCSCSFWVRGSSCVSPLIWNHADNLSVCCAGRNVPWDWRQRYTQASLSRYNWVRRCCNWPVYIVFDFLILNMITWGERLSCHLQDSRWYVDWTGLFVLLQPWEHYQNSLLSLFCYLHWRSRGWCHINIMLAQVCETGPLSSLLIALHTLLSFEAVKAGRDLLGVIHILLMSH